jgi:hypothetical protein
MMAAHALHYLVEVIVGAAFVSSPQDVPEET